MVVYVARAVVNSVYYNLQDKMLLCDSGLLVDSTRADLMASTHCIRSLINVK